jgi:hypothetical protein
MKQIKQLLAAVLILGSLAITPTLTTGCKTRLEQGGAYAPGIWTTNASGEVTFAATAAPDPAFYAIDSAYELAYSAINAAFTIERNNRAYFWSVTHSIKHALDEIRPKAVEANLRFLKARRIYLANPTPAGLSDLQTTLMQIQSLSSAATAVLPRQ